MLDLSGRPVVLRPRRLLDAVEDGVLRGREVVVERGTITAVRPVTDDQAGATVLDLGDVTLMPGLVDCHVHYTIDPRPEVRDGIAAGAVDPPAQVALVGARNARIALESGVTTARSAGSSRGLDIPLARAIARGDVPGPRLLAAGPAVTITGGHGRHFGVEVDSIPEMLRAIRLTVRDGAEVIKLVASEAAMLTSALAGVQELTQDELTAMVTEARRLRRRVLVHAQGSAAVAAAANAGADSIEHAFLADREALEALAASGAVLVPTLAVTDVYAARADLPPDVRDRQAAISEQHRASCQLAVELGIPLAAGTDCGVPAVTPDLLGREIALLADHGLPTIEAVRAATSRAATLLGLDEEIGSVAIGKRADLLVVPGDPLEDLSVLQQPLLVVQGGRVVHGTLPPGATSSAAAR